jgi:L-asparaginase II
VENIYRGDIAVVNAKGEINFSVRNSEKITYWRSAAKSIQALSVIYSGAADKHRLTDKEIAIF